MGRGSILGDEALLDEVYVVHVLSLQTSLL